MQSGIHSACCFEALDHGSSRSSVRVRNSPTWEGGREYWSTASAKYLWARTPEPRIIDGKAELTIHELYLVRGTSGP